MKAILYCNLPYAFSILKPLADALVERKFEILWYIPKDLLSDFPYHKSPHTSDMRDLERFNSDMIFVPGNDVPWYLRGVKVQIFHGLAGEKKGHFRIRDYFDLYLTQGPYFTKRFETLAKKHKDFSVKESGWSKLDGLFCEDLSIKKEKASLLEKTKAQKIILYAPTFSPSLTSAKKLFEHIITLSKREEYLLLIKFHDKMDEEIKKSYQDYASEKLILLEDKDITRALKLSDIMISDTSSVVYEFIFLNKPVITLESHSEHILWKDIQTPSLLEESVDTIFNQEDSFSKKREEVIARYHPYSDGKSSQRMIDATLAYIKEYGIPTKRAIPFHRKIKLIKKYGLLRW